jgi:hypothetical protein
MEALVDRRGFLASSAGSFLTTPLGVFWFTLAVLGIVILVRGWLWFL